MALPIVSWEQSPAVQSTDVSVAEAMIREQLARTFVSYRWSLVLKEQFGSVGADAVVNVFKNTFSNTSRGFLMLMLRYFEEQGRHQFPFVFQYIRDQEGQNLMGDQFDTFRYAIDTAAFLDPANPVYLEYLTHAIDRDYWTDTNTPRVVEYVSASGRLAFMDPERVKTGIRKHAANALSIIGTEESLKIIEKWAVIEAQSGDKQMAWGFSGTVNYVREYGEIRTLILEKDYVIGSPSLVPFHTKND
ncbi:MAG: hypothetical protein ACE15F_09470 [bacterium]